MGFGDLVAETIKSTAKLLKEEIDFKYEKGDVWDWIAKNRVIVGEPWSWEHAKIAVDLSEVDKRHVKYYVENGLCYLERAPRPYLKQYLNDKSRVKVVMKCRQSEFSESEINYALFNCVTKDYYNVRHLFPTSAVANQVAKEKISVAIDTSPNIKRMLRKPFNLTEKSFITNSFYTIDGAYNEHGGRGPSAEHIVFDEFNTHNPKVKDVYAASTEHARYGGLKIYISTPTMPHMGIHAEYLHGTQYTWRVTCLSCGREQTLEFPDNIINFVEKGTYPTPDEEDRALEQTYIGCRYCGAYIDKTSVEYENSCRWVAKYPMRKDVASYLVTGMMLAWKTGKEINKKYLRMRFVHQFYNEVIGIQYAGDSTRVSKEEVRACQDFDWRNIFRRTDDMRNLSVGVDYGESESWAVVVGDGVGMDDDQPRVLFVMRIANDTLEKYKIGSGSENHVLLVKLIVETFDADIVVNDANGIGIRDNAKLRSEFGERVWGAFYDVNDAKAEKLNKASVQVSWNDAKQTVTIPRTVELMETMECFKKKKYLIPREETVSVTYFVEHIHALTSTYYLDEETGKVYHRVQHIGPDHFAHAFTYARLGYEKIRVNSRRDKAKKRVAMSGS